MKQEMNCSYSAVKNIIEACVPLYGSYIYFRGSISITSPAREQVDSDKISLQFYKTGFLDVTKPKESQLLRISLI